MKKVNTSPISGMQEFLPREQAVFDNLKEQIASVFRRHGYAHLETPVIDRLEILLAKAGGETEKQIYKVVKTMEAASEADEGLRFDHTVPLARYVVEHEAKLTFPFKVTQIGRNWRGERAQKGRYREFYQCDIDVIGRGKLALAYDADVISTLLDVFREFQIETPVLARISNRKILTGFLRALGLSEKAAEIYNVVDHADKISWDEVRYALAEMGLEGEMAKKILRLIEIHGPREEVMTRLERLGISDEMFIAGMKELSETMQLLEAEGFTASIEADMKIVRGLDYYTGTVFEFILPEYRKVGSVGGGGRYENLAEHFTEQEFPGVGGSIGLSRLFQVLTENELLKQEVGKPLDYMVVPISENEIPFANKVARSLRDDGFKTTVIYSEKKLGEKIAYAAKLADNAIVVGEEEVRTGEYQVKKFE